MTMTRKDVVSVLGRVDDAMIAELILTEASLAELKEAWAWVFGDDALMGPTTHREAGGGRSSRGGTARVRTSWSKPSSVVFYTPAEVRELTPVRANVEELASKRPELRDVFLCHAWDDRQKAAKDLNDLLEARGVRVWFSEKDIGLGEPFMRSIDKIGQFARGNCVGDSRYAKHPP